MPGRVRLVAVLLESCCVRIDLHAHSSASDGTERPSQVVLRAAAAGLDVVALTDHDTLAGMDEATAALPAGLTLVPGVEISCEGGGMSLHLLGYLCDPAHPQLSEELGRLRTDRVRRAEAIVRRCIDLGASLSWERVVELADGGAVGRPHIARALVEAGAVPTVADAFSPDWIADGGRAYEAKEQLASADAIHLVRDAGGVPVFAHPRAQARGRTVSDDDIRDMARAGLAGLEVDHPDHTDEHRAQLRALADELGLLVTGSSDDHGDITGHRLGCETTTPEAYQRILGEAHRAPVHR